MVHKTFSIEIYKIINELKFKIMIELFYNREMKIK